MHSMAVYSGIAIPICTKNPWALQEAVFPINSSSWLHFSWSSTGGTASVCNAIAIDEGMSTMLIASTSRFVTRDIFSLLWLWLPKIRLMTTSDPRIEQNPVILASQTPVVSTLCGRSSFMVLLLIPSVIIVFMVRAFLWRLAPGITKLYYFECLLEN